MTLRQTLTTLIAAGAALIGAAATAAPIDIAARGLLLGSDSFSVDVEVAYDGLFFSAVTPEGEDPFVSLFGDVPVDPDLPFPPFLTGLTAGGDIGGGAIATGFDTDLIEFLVEIDPALTVGIIAIYGPFVLVSITGMFGDDPFATLAATPEGIRGVLTVTDLAAIPVPAAFPLLAVALGGLVLAGMRRARR